MVKLQLIDHKYWKSTIMELFEVFDLRCFNSYEKI